jgi:hypothetical protein
VGVKSADGLYVPAPVTVAVPTVVPPAVHVVGAVVCGPNTLNVTVPVAGVVALDSTALIELAEMAVFGAPVAGAETVVVGLALLTVVEFMPDPQVLLDALLFVSPP